MATDFTIADVLAWARTKPADEPYVYVSNDKCAVATFLQETGRASRPHVSANQWRDAGGHCREFDISIDTAAVGVNSSVAEATPLWTYGQFADRLEQVQA